METDRPANDMESCLAAAITLVIGVGGGLFMLGWGVSLLFRGDSGWWMAFVVGLLMTSGMVWGLLSKKPWRRIPHEGRQSGDGSPEEDTG